MYLQDKKSASNPDSLKKLDALWARIDSLYNTQKVFYLSLDTLELTRRFDDLYRALKLLQGLSRSDYSKLMVISRHLEKNLFEELP